MDRKKQKTMPAPQEADLSIVVTTAGSADATGRDILTVQQFIDTCTRLQPVRAAEQRDSDLCVTALVEYLIVDGEVIKLSLVDGRWAALYVRVSDDAQRSAKSGKTVADGFSEEEQLHRGVRYLISKRFSWKVYSDCGISGDYPVDDDGLVRRLLQGRAARYRKIYTRTLLDETSILRRTAAELLSMNAYLDRQCGKILQSNVSEEQIYEADDLTVRQRIRLRGRPRKHVFFRQAYTQLWQDIEQDKVHMIAVSDRSRLNRAADLETEFLQRISQHGVRLHGLIEDLSTLDVSDPLRKGTTYLLASVNEYRLEELAGHSFRGRIQAMAEGNTSGRLPWWLRRTKEGKSELIPGADEIVRQIVSLYLSGLGFAAVATRLDEENVRVDGKRLTSRQIKYMLDSDALVGVQWQLGLAWDIFPPVLDAETLEDLRGKRDRRTDALKNLHETEQWADHLFTGLLHCCCGARLIFNAARKTDKEKGRGGYYRCLTRNAQETEDSTHAWINEDTLDAFLSEILRHNPNLLTGEFACELSDPISQSTAQRSLLQEEWTQAKRVFDAEEKLARGRAEELVEGMGIKTGAPGFRDAVSGIVKGLMGEKQEALDTLRRDIDGLSGQISDDRRKRELTASVQRLQGWDALDNTTRNRLLRTIFARVTVFPMDKGGYLSFQLSSLDVALPPVKMRRLKAKQIVLPTAKEWIGDMLRYATDPDWVTRPEQQMTSRTMRPFNTYLKVARTEASAIGALAARLYADKEFPARVYYKPRVCEYIRLKGCSEEEIALLDEMWQRYAKAEVSRREARQLGEPSPLPDEQA
jgi:DNA invertase Pin-like site-specific DNA recombinase/uncharacterized protein YozE (UPF0346 family)